MTDYWKGYWNRHAAGMSSDDALRQVLRVENDQPVSDHAFAAVTAHVIELLELQPTHEVLDLCCGNGLLSAAIEPHVARIVGVDFCQRLLGDVASRTTSKTSTVLADARTLSLPDASLDRILLAAALQHFARDEVVRLFRRLATALRPQGIMLVSDIPDVARLWVFHDSPERETAHFEHEGRGEPLLGTWFDRAWLEKLGRHAGFLAAVALDQPASHPYARYRFDLLCRR